MMFIDEKILVVPKISQCNAEIILQHNMFSIINNQ